VLVPILRIVAICTVVVCVLLLLFQDRLLYHPRAYPFGVPLRAGVEPLVFTTVDGPQACWWKAPRSGGRWWLCFAGNASLARSWLDLFDGDDGLLLIDYPGYGESAGKPSPRSILAASEGAVAALQRAHPALPAPHGAIGHSLGAAAALQYVAAHPVSRVVLVAPFTRMLDMARLVVGWPLCHLLIDRWDNRSRLQEITARGGTAIDIWHGDQDAVVPVAMSRSLAAGFPAIRYHEVAGADHNGILAETAAHLLEP
jgi:pimeloyl-ACP methyl ester carboxylesterase